MNSIGNRKEIRKHQKIVKCAVDAAKEVWICKVACDAEKARKDGQQRWTCIRQLQMAHAGHRARPARQTALLKENVEMMKSPNEAVL